MLLFLWQLDWRENEDIDNYKVCICFDLGLLISASFFKTKNVRIAVAKRIVFIGIIKTNQSMIFLFDVWESTMSNKIQSFFTYGYWC